MKKTIEELKELLTYKQELIKPTETSQSQFQQNVRCEFFCETLSGVIGKIEEQQSFIGLDVYKFKNNEAVTTLKAYENEKFKELNPIEDQSFKYTESIHEQFITWYLDFLIGCFSDELITGIIRQNSTNPFSNLIYRWKLEETQALIKLFKDLNKKS
jgi:hypothetical protein